MARLSFNASTKAHIMRLPIISYIRARRRAAFRVATIMRVAACDMSRAKRIDSSPMLQRLFETMHGDGAALPHQRAAVAAVLADWRGGFNA